jgi:hypothetical protein
MKVTSILSSVLALSATGTAYFTELPTTVKGGVEVVDTPLVREAIKVVEKFIPLQPYLYNHVMRCWLFGAAVINANKTLKASVDLEAHALGTILHDLGWDSTLPKASRL